MPEIQPQRTNTKIKHKEIKKQFNDQRRHHKFSLGQQVRYNWIPANELTLGYKGLFVIEQPVGKVCYRIDCWSRLFFFLYFFGRMVRDFLTLFICHIIGFKLPKDIYYIICINYSAISTNKLHIFEYLYFLLYKIDYTLPFE